MDVPKQIAGLLLSAIISDTLMFRSPTCTPLDKSVAEVLAVIAEVDIETYAKNMFQAGSNFSGKTTEEIFYQDFKIFHTDDCDFGVAQISAMSREELDKVADTSVYGTGACREEDRYGLCHADRYLRGIFEDYF